MALFSSAQASVRAQFLPRFPARVQAGTGMIITKSGHSYVFEIDPSYVVGYDDFFTATEPGIVPASGGGTVNFLRSDGVWVPPPILGGGAPIDSPVFVGDPTAPTPPPGDNDTSIATTEFVAASFAPLASPVFTGDPKAPTPAPGDNDTSIATTAFVNASFAKIASPTFTGDPKAPTPAATDNDTSIATSAFVQSALGLRLLQVLTPSGAGTVEILGIDDTYAALLFVFDGLVPNAISNLTYELRVGTTWQTTGYFYIGVQNNTNATTTVTGVGASSVAEVPIAPSQATNGTHRAYGFLKLYRPGQGVAYKRADSLVSIFNASGDCVVRRLTSGRSVNDAVTGIRFYYPGTTTTGVIRVYGERKA